MRFVVMPAMLAGLLALANPAAAQSMNGCWHYSDGSVFSTVCFSGSNGGTFNLEYAIEDQAQGLVKGSCNGRIEISAIDGDQAVFTVPYQEEACRQEDQVFRLAKRDYSCERAAPTKLACSLTVFYDDGTVFSEATGLEYTR